MGDACDNCPLVPNPLQGPAPGVKVGFCVDERILFDARLGGLDRLLEKLDLGRAWEMFGHCSGRCPGDIVREIEVGLKHAETYLDHFDGDALGAKDVRAFLLGMDGSYPEAVAEYMDRVIYRKDGIEKGGSGKLEEPGSLRELQTIGRSGPSAIPLRGAKGSLR